MGLIWILSRRRQTIKWVQVLVKQKSFPKTRTGVHIIEYDRCAGNVRGTRYAVTIGIGGTVENVEGVRCVLMVNKSQYAKLVVEVKFVSTRNRNRIAECVGNVSMAALSETVRSARSVHIISSPELANFVYSVSMEWNFMYAPSANGAEELGCLSMDCAEHMLLIKISLLHQ